MKQITVCRDALHRGTLILVNALYGVVWDMPEALTTVRDDTQAKRRVAENGVQAKPQVAENGALAKPQVAENGVQAKPQVAENGVQTKPQVAENGVQMTRQAAAMLGKLVQEIGGWDSIVPVSGWRSMAEQQAIWDSCLQENGPKYTQTYVAVPGHSEHQTGLAIDLGLRQEHIDFICPEFPDTGICGQFRRRAADYGFILRYPAGKEAVTGIGCEPWHFRYVGVPHARIMEENNQTLEEYTDYIRQFDSPLHPYCIRIGGRAVYVSFVTATPGETVIEVNETAPYQISGNNVDGFVLTQWT